jgi:hypothetical protein
MVGYGGEIMRYLGEKLAAFGDWCKDVLYKMTHEPLWIGVTIAVVLLMILLIVIKRRNS